MARIGNPELAFALSILMLTCCDEFFGCPLSNSHHGAVNSRLRVGGSNSLPPMVGVFASEPRAVAGNPPHGSRSVARVNGHTPPPAGKGKRSSSSLQPATWKSMAAADPSVSSPPFLPPSSVGAESGAYGDAIDGDGDGPFINPPTVSSFAK